MEPALPQGAARAPDWASLPSDVVLLVEACLSRQSNAHLESLRATCSAWRHALTPAPATLQPLGKPAQLGAFPQAVSLDYSARGAGQALCDEELEAACRQLGGRLQALDIGGAFQLTPAGLQRALRCCTALRSLAADGSTVQDAAFAVLARPSNADGSGSSSSPEGRLCAPLGSPQAVGPPLQQLQSLSLRGCPFLRGSLLADLAAACPKLASLDMADCALALGLNPEVSALLPRLASLRRLVLDGDGVDDVAMRHIAALPHLRELSVRGSAEVTDWGLRHLAERRGSTAPLARTSSASSVRSEAEEAGGGCGATVDVGLVALDISACTGLTDQCWLAITEMQGLTSLHLEHMAHLLQFPAMPEALPAALWRLPRLRRLSLAGSCCHPSKLKLLAATCGSSITHLDIGAGGSGGGCVAPSGCVGCGPCCCAGAGAGGGWEGAAQAAGPPHRRLTSLHERDLCEAAACFRQLHTFSAAGSALPLRACTAFLEAAGAGRLSAVDLGGCCLDAEPAAAATQHSHQAPWQRQLFFSSGARRALHFDSYPAITGTSAARLQQLHAEADSWQRPATAARFAAALRRHAASLRCLRLGGAAGVTDRHLSSLRCLGALEWLCLAGSRVALSPTLLLEAAAGCPRLRRLDISHTAADDGCLAAAASLPSLRQLAACGCAHVGSRGVQALAAGPAARTLRWLDLSLTGVDDGAVAELAASCRQLRGLQLTGCHKLTPAGVVQLAHLDRLASLSLCRCPQAVTDASLRVLAQRLGLLTRLGLSEAQLLTAEGLAAALPLLPCLAHLDLTCCWQLRDEQLLSLLGGPSRSTGSDGDAGASSSSAVGPLAVASSGSGWITPANIQLPKGGSSPTGSPFKRRAQISA